MVRVALLRSLSRVLLELDAVLDVLLLCFGLLSVTDFASSIGSTFEWSFGACKGAE